MTDGEPIIERVRRDHLDRTDDGVDRWIRDVFAENHERLHGLILGSCRDPEIAADLTQEAFLRLLQQARAGRPPSNPTAWLYRVAINLLVSRGRKLTVARRHLHRLLSDRRPDTPEAVVVGREGATALSQALGELSVVHRSALLMAAQGVSGRDIASYLGKSEGATRTLLLRARRSLREAVDAREGLP